MIDLLDMKEDVDALLHDLSIPYEEIEGIKIEATYYTETKIAKIDLRKIDTFNGIFSPDINTLYPDKQTIFNCEKVFETQTDYEDYMKLYSYNLSIISDIDWDTDVGYVIGKEERTLVN